MLLRRRSATAAATATGTSTLRLRRPKKRSQSPDLVSPPCDHRKYMRDTISAISNTLRYSPWSAALTELRGLSVRWDSYTVNRVLKTHPPMQKSWLFFNWAKSLHGFKHDQFTYTTMLDIFGEAGRLESMWMVFSEMEEMGLASDAATYTSLMHWTGKAGDLEGAQRAWEDIRAKGCWPTVVSYTAFMKILFDFGRPAEAAKVYREMLEVGLRPNCHTYTVLMEFLAGEGKFHAALEVMNEMQEAGVPPDKASCNILVQKFSRAGATRAMTEVLNYMKLNRIVLRRPVFLEALEALRISGESDSLLLEVNPHLAFEGNQEESLQCGATPIDTDTGFLIDRDIIVNFLARRNFLAVDLMMNRVIDENKFVDQNLVSDVIMANCVNQRQFGALSVFDRCRISRRQLDRLAYTSLLGVSIRTNSFPKVLEIIEEMSRAGIRIGTYLTWLIVYKLGCSGLTSAAAKVFYWCSEDQNALTFTALMNAYFISGKVDQGLDLLASMRRMGVSASLGTYQVLITALTKANRHEDAEIYRKQKKQLLWSGFRQEKSLMEEKMCNLLYDLS